MYERTNSKILFGNKLLLHKLLYVIIIYLLLLLHDVLRRFVEELEIMPTPCELGKGEG